MNEFVLKEIVGANIESELIKIGFDSSYCAKASKKYQYRNLKIYSLSAAQANILKQTALSCGADCATNRNVITGQIEKSAVILGGSESELNNIAQKLKFQPFSLGLLANKILEFLQPKCREMTQLVGILNVTPDSFSDGGMYLDGENARQHFLQMVDDGANFIDIGAESTRPSSKEVPANEQIRRLDSILDFVNSQNKVTISVDTRSAIVADYVLDKGAHYINDVSGFDFDSKMPEVIAKHGAGVIIQHSKGIPENMQDNPLYTDVVQEVYDVLFNKIEIAKSLGINDIIIDPGIGFGKKKEDNFEILNRIEEFYSLGCKVMVGISRKSFLGVTSTDNELKDSLSLAVSYPLIQKRVDYLRVHNVKLHAKLINMLN